MRTADLMLRARIRWYRTQWDCAHIEGAPTLVTPALVMGRGSVRFADPVTIGWRQSAGFYSTYVYIEARAPGSSIDFGEGCHVNNDAAFVSDGEGISIGKRCLVGPRAQILDSDFHALGPDRSQPAKTAPVRIGDDVFIGSSVTILKGCVIGNGAVIGAGSVVSGSVATGAVVAGNPARPVRA